MYANSPYVRTTVTNPNAVQLPQRAGGPAQCYIDWRWFGFILALLSAATCALGVADVIYTYQTYMINKQCNSNPLPGFCDPNVLVFTWVAVGIWASIPVFVFAISVLRFHFKPFMKVGCTVLLALLCVFVFTLAMIIISALEVWKGVGRFYWPNIDSSSPDDTVKVALPLAIAATGIIELLMCAIALPFFCYFCLKQLASPTTEACEPPPIACTTTANTTFFERPYEINHPSKASACQNYCETPSYAVNGIYNAPNSSCPRPTTYNNFRQQIAPNPAYSYYVR